MEQWMREAIAEACKARAMEEVPIGCVIMHEPTGRIVGRGHNRRQTDRDPTAHAEIIALRAAAAKLGNYRLSGATLYVTLEPCPMCAGAMVHARVARVVYGAADPLAGSAGTVFNLLNAAALNHRADVQGGVLAEECSQRLKVFFQGRRGRTGA
jgi:tRNA(adenine34) deaminase